MDLLPLLATDEVALGVSDDGSFTNAAAEVNVGMLYDPDGSGPAPVGGDIVLPGDPYEAWGLDYVTADGTRASYDNAGEYHGTGNPLGLVAGAVVDNDALVGITHRGGDAWITVTHQVVLSKAWPVAWITITVDTDADLDELTPWRAIDLDPDVWLDGNYQTDNVLDSGPPAIGSGQGTGRAVALAAPSGIAGVCSFCLDPASIESQPDYVGYADTVMGIVVRDSLPAFTERSYLFVYAFAPTNDEAIALAEWAVEEDDRDQDGTSPAEGDCDDLDPRVGSGHKEVADGLDNDCDGGIDEYTGTSDDDGDGYTEAMGDCDDSDPEVNPGATDRGTDANCDGLGSWGPLPEAESSTEEVPVAATGCGCASNGRELPTSWTGMVLAMLGWRGSRRGGDR
jgi:hypothetical protein